MNDLRSFAALQTRVYEFLEHQDEATLRAIISGAARLAVIAADKALPADSIPHENDHIASHSSQPGATAVELSRDPVHVAYELSRLSSERRRSYLTAAKLSVSELRGVAKRLGLTGYSRLAKAGLVEALISFGLVGTGMVADRPPAKVSSPSNPADVPVAVARPNEPTEPNAEAAHIASHLRGTETEEEGAAYLRARQLDRASLLAVAAELHLTRVDRLSRAELEKRVLKQAIGARRKFAGLRKW